MVPPSVNIGVDSQFTEWVPSRSHYKDILSGRSASVPKITLSYIEKGVIIYQ